MLQTKTFLHLTVEIKLSQMKNQVLSQNAQHNLQE